MATGDNIAFHQNQFMIELCKMIGADPEVVTDLTVNSDGSDQVQIRWEGLAYMPAQVFEDLLTKHKIAKGSEVKEEIEVDQ